MWIHEFSNDDPISVCLLWTANIHFFPDTLTITNGGIIYNRICIFICMDIGYRQKNDTKISESKWWYIDVNSINDLLPSGDKPLFQPLLVQFHVTRPQWVKKLKLKFTPDHTYFVILFLHVTELHYHWWTVLWGREGFFVSYCNNSWRFSYQKQHFSNLFTQQKYRKTVENVSNEYPQWYILLLTLLDHESGSRTEVNASIISLPHTYTVYRQHSACSEPTFWLFFWVGFILRKQVSIQINCIRQTSLALGCWLSLQVIDDCTITNLQNNNTAVPGIILNTKRQYLLFRPDTISTPWIIFGYIWT